MEGNGNENFHGGRNNCTEGLCPAAVNRRAAELREDRRRSIAERRAAKCGFDAMPDWLTASSSPLRVVPPAYVTLSPGISPTALLDSPVALLNSMEKQNAHGTFEFPEMLNQESFALSSISHHNTDGIINTRMPEYSISFPSTYTSKSQQSLGWSPPIESSNNCNNKQADDGYKWRKYGQKQVKGSEFPRSYYKCSQPKCGAKKKVERSPDGQITEIVYKGSHNHPQPVDQNGSSFFRNFYQLGSSRKDNDNGLVQEDTTFLVPADILSSSVTTKSNDLSAKTMSGFLFESAAAATPELSSTLASVGNGDEDIDEDGATPIHGRTASQIGDDGGSPEPKRRRKDGSFGAETSLLTRSVREPRVVVQIESEIDVLDDGYRWRKYGQKVVKGNLNPRSYYKCTSVGCPVRKQVERASDNTKSVLTMYEGKHNHDVPPPNKSQTKNNPNNPNPIQNHHHRHHHHSSSSFHFDPKPIENELLRPYSFNGSRDSAIALPSSIYQIPPLHSSLPAYNYHSNLQHQPEFPMNFLPITLLSNFHHLADFNQTLTVGNQQQMSENSSIYGPTSPTDFCSRVVQHFPS